MGLSSYIQDEQTKCFDSNGVFFAFSDKQFNEQKQDGTQYVSLGAGTICPKENVKAFLQEHSQIVKNGIEQDIAENGKEAIIQRELNNFECSYTGDYTDCLEALKDYGFTEQDIKNVFYK